HPLVERGFPSIGCMPCTRPVAEGEDARAGRWSGWDKVECGIHRPGEEPFL
ncbi:MAG TPA: phosphoadenosine phosphosulfate reductase, partial [Hyphomonas atlantica]|nr:phosphoadenosine phosphosulfate reductase [Hyphomonas atlantica]